MIRATLCVAVLFSMVGAATGEVSFSRTVHVLRTKNGETFAVWGEKPSAPAPTLLILGGAAIETLDNAYFRQCGNILADRGYLCVSVDLPGHGAFGADDSGGLARWRFYTDHDMDFVAKYNKKLSKVLDHLIAERFSDAERIAACGTSRGGFAAIHFAGADARVKCVAAFAPVTDLTALSEFRGAEKDAMVETLGLSRLANALAGRPLWISIGVQDDRVSTDCARAFSEAVAAASAGKNLPNRFEMKIDAETREHTTPKGAAEAAATWIEDQLR